MRGSSASLFISGHRPQLSCLRVTEPTPINMSEKYLGEKPYRSYDDDRVEESPDSAVGDQIPNDVFGPEEHHDIHYKTLTWQLVAVLMIAEIVSNGMLSLPSSLAVVGLVPGLVLIVFLGVFALFTSWILIQFKLRHPQGTSVLDPLD